MTALATQIYILMLLGFSSIFNVNSQQEERIYYSDFSDPTDWTTYSFGEGINWRPSNYTWCSGFESGPCLELRGKAAVSRVISTKGYHDIRIKFSMCLYL